MSISQIISDLEQVEVQVITDGVAGPRGEKGDKGDQGNPGTPGDKGDKGDQGTTGDKGDKGDQGDPGTLGDKGDKGDQGDPGTPGDKGDKGDQGDPGAPGDKGDKGDQGDPGSNASIYAEDGSVTPPNNFLDLRGGGRGTFWETRSSNGGGAAEGGIYPGFWADGTGFEADNSEGGHTYLHTAQDSGSYNINLPASNGTLASQEWVEDQAYIADAPDNGLTYARNSGSWVVIGVASNSVAPVLSPSGSTSTGVQLSVSHGTWSGNPSSYSYQWQVSTDGSTWTDISGATASTFTPNSNYATKYVRAAVIATNGFGPSDRAYSDATSQFSVSSFPSGAIAYWKLDDDGSGGVSLIDSTGNGYDLANNNGVALGTGILNGCSVFGGSGYLTNTTLSTASQFSISFWFNYISYNVTNSTISSCDGAVLYNDGNYFINYTDSTNLSTANYNTWNHFVATFDGTDYKSYFNGVLIATTAVSATCSYINFGSFNEIQICDGKLDEAAIWPRALSAEEVTALFGGGTPPSYS